MYHRSTQRLRPGLHLEVEVVLMSIGARALNAKEDDGISIMVYAFAGIIYLYFLLCCFFHLIGWCELSWEQNIPWIEESAASFEGRVQQVTLKRTRLLLSRPGGPSRSRPSIAAGQMHTGVEERNVSNRLRGYQSDLAIVLVSSAVPQNHGAGVLTCSQDAQGDPLIT